MNHLHASDIEHLRQTHQQETAAAKLELENALEQSRVQVRTKAQPGHNLATTKAQPGRNLAATMAEQGHNLATTKAQSGHNLAATMAEPWLSVFECTDSQMYLF